MLYAEDLVEGVTHELGTYLVTAEDIVEFASRWDPQGFHVDEDVARAGVFGGLIASGIHSLAIVQRLAVTGLFQKWAVIAGRSLTDLQMTSPVRPGMELRGTLRVDAVEEKGPDRALVHQSVVLWHDDTEVLRYSGTAYVARRPG
ncbi:MAG: hypothetical protein JWP74_320 [Marmoricola sp.]|nr:hypothetical protein [Marmoricola sp.]